MRAIVMAVGLGASVACGGPGGPPAGTVLGVPVEASGVTPDATPVSDALAGPAERPVVLIGTIGEVCQVGCWFYLQDSEGVVFVDVVGDYAVPREASGRKAIVVGTTRGEGGARIVLGRSLLLR